MSKGLGIKVIGGMTLALVGVSILLSAFSTNYGGGSEGIFCSTYESVSVVFPGKDSPPPKGCNEGRTVDYKAVNVDSKTEFNLKLSNAVISCYDQYQGYNTSEFCEGWNVKGLPNTVNEAGFTSELKENDLCPESIENSELENGGDDTCGSSNQIYFEKEEIEADDFIVIQYNSTNSGTQRVEVG